MYSDGDGLVSPIEFKQAIQASPLTLCTFQASLLLAFHFSPHLPCSFRPPISASPRVKSTPSCASLTVTRMVCQTSPTRCFSTSCPHPKPS
eukprot:194113-Hanusia_phi.AAC.1